METESRRAFYREINFYFKFQRNEEHVNHRCPECDARNLSIFRKAMGFGEVDLDDPWIPRNTSNYTNEEQQFGWHNRTEEI